MGLPQLRPEETASHDLQVLLPRPPSCGVAGRSRYNHNETNTEALALSADDGVMFTQPAASNACLQAGLPILSQTDAMIELCALTRCARHTSSTSRSSQQTRHEADPRDGRSRFASVFRSPEACRSTRTASRSTDRRGRGQLVQATTLDRWSDGSMKWMLVDFLADHDGGGGIDTYQLTLDSDRVERGSSPAVSVSNQNGELSINTGAARFRLRANGRFPFEDVLIGGVWAVDATRTGFELETGDRRATTFRIERIEVEDAGPVRAVVRADGWVRREANDRFVQVIAYLHFLVGSATVRFDVTLRNPRRAQHRGGFWELGDPGSIHVRDVSFVVALLPASDPLEVRCSPEQDAPFQSYREELELYQSSSGGANWNSTNHLNRRRQVPFAFRGYRLQAVGIDYAGLRATPVVSMTRGPRHLSVTMPHFWQNFPKAIEAAGDKLILRLFPRQHGDLHELQAGEQKTHVFFVAFAHDAVSESPLDWARAPLLARMTPEHYCASGAVPYMLPSVEDDPAYSGLVNAAIDGADAFEQKREVIDEFGWRNFGDLYADHEAAFCRGPGPLVSHYNNQYDAIAGLACQFMRSADPRWWRLCADLAAHVRDIDLYRTDLDKTAYNHALFWHTFHYVDVGLATHRSYPQTERVGGGGPSNEHNYSRGLLLHYFLTGEAGSRDAVVDLARWVIDMDDGDKTVFKWLAGGETGLASQTASPLYHGPGRGAGNSIKVLLDGHTVTSQSHS